MAAIEQLALEAIDKFYEMSKDQFLDLPSVERSFIAGCIIGNFAAHHPQETFSLLHQIKRKKS